MARVLLLELAAQLGGVDGDVDDAGLVEPEHDLALQRVRRVVEVDDRPRRSLDALVRALDQLLAALRQHLDRHVVGDAVLGDELADEVEVGLARRREADLDLLEPHRRRAASNMCSLRAGSIGSISAWLPSRRSTEHHSGALSMTRLGQVRSVSTIGTCGAYFANGMGLG